MRNFVFANDFDIQEFCVFKNTQFEIIFNVINLIFYM